ncbi:glycoside hydrolase family 18 protein [Candidatus Microgenomates bacterium]|nr:glycoside hydrolase family 18 protein [Candidatus Microgenomates bacterium]
MRSWGTALLTIGLILSFIGLAKVKPVKIKHSINKLFSPLDHLIPIKPLHAQKPGKEIFGFLPYWNLSNTDSIDFETLTTLAYFGVPIKKGGELDRSNIGYKIFKNNTATEIFQKAHHNGTKVVLTITQMDNNTILKFLDSKSSQDKTITEVVDEVDKRGVDGVNIDFEYIGDPGKEYANKFTTFAGNLTRAMHAKNPDSYVTTSVLAGSVKNKNLYNIGDLASNTDGIFMMAYDFATYRADTVMPTSPLFGYKEGKYWYDVSSAVNDFLQVMPAEKLVLGLPWYGYDYPVLSPGDQATVYQGYASRYKEYYKKNGKLLWRWRTVTVRPSAGVQTYSDQVDLVSNGQEYQQGWDDVGKVGWKAYKNKGDNFWRMSYVEDQQSLGQKYEFAKEKDLGGVGMWALGFEEDKRELWNQLSNKFEDTNKNATLSGRKIAEVPN